MGTISMVISSSLAIAFVLAAPQIKYYATKYDHLDVDTVLNSRRLVNYYAACLTNKGPCPPQGIEFKRILPEALHTNCARCTEKQKVVALRSIKRIRKEYPKVWKQLSDIWDPTGEYIKRFEESFKNYSNGAPSPTTEPSVAIIANRFADDSNATSAAPPSSTTVKTTPRPAVTTSTTFSTTTTTTKPTITSTTNKVTNKVLTSASSIKPVTVTTKSPPVKTTGILTLPPLPSTVSFNNPLSVNGLVSRIGAVGSKLIQAGTRIAGMLLTTVQTVVGQ